MPLAAVLLLISCVARGDVGLQFVTVGDPGNLGDTTVMAHDGTTGYGKVDYTYEIGKYDVTLTQYTVFLNSVAATDTFSLWNPGLQTDLNIAGIARTGSIGSYTYSVIGDGNRPVTDVSWFDAARFTNWLQNGQPVGAQVAGITETGAYALNGDTTFGNVQRSGNATYWIPNENEWYKAAYYDPTISGANKYWLYATRSNSAPGNQIGNSPNQANYFNGVYCTTQSSTIDSSASYLTDVGAFVNSGSYYGTFDQSGDVSQWNDVDIIPEFIRYVRGGHISGDASIISSSYHGAANPALENKGVGFRVAAVPEPGPAMALMLGAAVLLPWRQRLRTRRALL